MWFEAAGGLYKRAMFDFDLGAQRKLDRGRLGMILDSNTSEGSAVTLIVRGMTRTLCRLA